MKISRFLKIVHYFHGIQSDLNSLFLTTFCFQFVGTLNPSETNISWEKSNLDLFFLTNPTKIWNISSFLQIFTNTHTGSKLKFDRARKLIFSANGTSIWFKDFECNKTSNSNAKHHLNQNIHVQHHRSSRGRAFSKTLRFGMQRAVNRQPGNHSGNSKGRSPSTIVFPKIWNFQNKISSF